MSPTPSVTRTVSHGPSEEELKPSRIIDPAVPPYSARFTDPRLAAARKVYLRTMLGGVSMMVVLVILCYFSIYWGALYKVPAHPLSGWVVNFDDGAVGESVMQGFLQSAASKAVRWEEKTGVNAEDVGPMILEQHAWVAVVSAYSSVIQPPFLTYD